MTKTISKAKERQRLRCYDFPPFSSLTLAQLEDRILADWHDHRGAFDLVYSINTYFTGENLSTMYILDPYKSFGLGTSSL